MVGEPYQMKIDPGVRIPKARIGEMLITVTDLQTPLCTETYPRTPMASKGKRDGKVLIPEFLLGHEMDTYRCLYIGPEAIEGIAGLYPEHRCESRLG
jgi:hypothetical protein